LLEGKLKIDPAVRCRLEAARSRQAERPSKPAARDPFSPTNTLDIRKLPLTSKAKKEKTKSKPPSQKQLQREREARFWICPGSASVRGFTARNWDVRVLEFAIGVPFFAVFGADC
jgi:hypothetical protein